MINYEDRNFDLDDESRNFLEMCDKMGVAMPVNIARMLDEQD